MYLYFGEDSDVKGGIIDDPLFNWFMIKFRREFNETVKLSKLILDDDCLETGNAVEYVSLRGCLSLGPPLTK